jgi:hypothetical protein
MQGHDDPDNFLFSAGYTMPDQSSSYDLNRLARANNWGTPLPAARTEHPAIQQQYNLAGNPEQIPQQRELSSTPTAQSSLAYSGDRPFPDAATSSNGKSCATLPTS